MPEVHSQPGPSRRDLYDRCISGEQNRPFIPRLRSDPTPFEPVPHSLVEFRAIEGKGERERRLRALWQRLSSEPHRGHLPWTTPSKNKDVPVKDLHDLTPERAREMKKVYDEELAGKMNGHLVGSLTGHVSWEDFKAYADAKEVELWRIFHDELDLDGNGHLDARELEHALEHAGINLNPSTLADFMTSLSKSPHSHAINFTEFRDFLLFMPRRASTEEIYRFYEVHKFLGDDGRGAARVNMEGDVTLSAEDRPPSHPTNLGRSLASKAENLDAPVDHTATALEGGDEEEEEDHQGPAIFGGATALRFLLAGGIAGAVSRTCTAPFDRLKIFLITRPPDMGGAKLAGAAVLTNPKEVSKASLHGAKALANAVTRIYAEGGILAFWVGNGLSVVKIFPESAIKFLTYESSKKVFARYWDQVEDTRDISGVSRFVSGGIGGISSQLSIYPIETLKTQMMSSSGEQRRTLAQAARHVWDLGGIRAYYRGLTIGLVGVFPYAAIDMSTFEGLKLAYLRSTGKDEPGVLALLAFGSISGSVGATSVYPLNLVRTRLQASGSSGHPQRYTGFRDVIQKTYARDGWRGFYRGLFPTLAKVVPAVSISYVVYESSKRKLGV
ncbi:mitochondrial carrier [Punctularia strigosozonata HHB-11173 SS5]|uniref:mitochondrial carrier n=1 Tax=Punctularia strigosozonata (strain HHB-11173) TaxID=741275 RepID=UPI0004416FFC|nr:mitochondrial carrier [Punctularia strigosozonata HHB-11173 SS5]EIN10446.1 mitochondrial carrier [Punctularia strigosozonata HHB-11173 SS5]